MQRRACGRRLHAVHLVGMPKIKPSYSGRVWVSSTGMSAGLGGAPILASTSVGSVSATCAQQGRVVGRRSTGEVAAAYVRCRRGVVAGGGQRRHALRPVALGCTCAHLEQHALDAGY